MDGAPGQKDEKVIHFTSKATLKSMNLRPSQNCFLPVSPFSRYNRDIQLKVNLSMKKLKYS